MLNSGFGFSEELVHHGCVDYPEAVTLFHGNQNPCLDMVEVLNSLSLSESDSEMTIILEEKFIPFFPSGVSGVIFLKKRQQILFFKDQYGRKSLLISFPKECSEWFIGPYPHVFPDPSFIEVPPTGLFVFRLNKLADVIKSHQVSPKDDSTASYLYSSKFDKYCCPYKIQPAYKSPSFLQNGQNLQPLSETELTSSILGILNNYCRRQLLRLPTPNTPVLLLYSGGLDSSLLAAVLLRNLPPGGNLYLIHGSFDKDDTPDRITCLSSFPDLPGAKLLLIDASKEWLVDQEDAVLAILGPNNDVVDFNIASCLLSLCGGCTPVSATVNESKNFVRHSPIQIEPGSLLFVGSGADELFGGYGRHVTRNNYGGASSVRSEMTEDLSRLWYRNLGRDDRAVGYNLKNFDACYPYLDQSIVDFVGNLSVECVLGVTSDETRAKMHGVGLHNNKILLRRCAEELGLSYASKAKKRALHFGSKAAKMTNVIHGVSNRQANGNRKYTRVGKQEGCEILTE